MNVQTGFIHDTQQRTFNPEEDYFVLKNLTKERLSFDKGLFETKWFDYRFMTSFQATMRYVDAFEAVGRRIYRREFDLERSKHIHFTTSASYERRLTEDLDPKERVRLAGFWRGRQVADALGMPYDTFIDLAMTYRMRHWKRTYLPLPTQLYGSNVVERVQERWVELLSADRFLPEHHAYMNQNYQGLPAQNDFHEFLFTQSETGGDRTFQLSDFVRQDLLPLSKIEARLSDYDYEKVLESL